MELSRRSVLALAAGLPLPLVVSGRAQGAPTAAPAVEPSVRYTMTAFTNASETDLYVYESTDATTFQPVRGPAYTPPGGLLRDPSLIRHKDGRFYLTYTTGWEGQPIGFARSDDRINWAHLYDYQVKVPGVTSTWAPEWFVDPGGEVSVLVSLSDGYRFTPHLMTATDAELRSWTPLTPMAGLAAKDDVGYGYIDTTVVHHLGRYYAFTKNESTKYLELAVAEQLGGRYSFVQTDDWAGWGTPREGQSVIRLPDGGWRIFFDAYNDGKYYFSDSRDDFRTWAPPAELPGLSGTVRHFTVLAESRGAGPAHNG
ncbi:family 43 glycosylhydrolase [Nocardia crassostreae]|uniref:family 43 glycosylhydrolase n=1 Tax=Nocardia crassostreae TaxID=53428 RepID=UPI000832B925|nr:family 43 glycosylhydrolase [Nocardia crassostreae]